MTPKHLNIHNIYLFRYTNEEAEILETVSAPILVTTHDIGKSHPNGNRRDCSGSGAGGTRRIPHNNFAPLALSAGCRHPAAP